MSEVITVNTDFYFDADLINKDRIDSIAESEDFSNTLEIEYTKVHSAQDIEFEKLSKNFYLLSINMELDTNIDVQNILQNFVDKYPALSYMSTFAKHENSTALYPTTAIDQIEKDFTSYRLAYYIGDSIREDMNIYAVRPFPWEDAPSTVPTTHLAIERKSTINPASKEERKKIVVQSQARIVFDNYYH